MIPPDEEKVASDVSEAEIGSMEIAKIAKTDMVGVSHDNVIEHLDLEKLAGANEVTRDRDVGFRRSRLAARMVVLCVDLSYVQLFRFSSKGCRFVRLDQAGFFT